MNWPQDEDFHQHQAIEHLKHGIYTREIVVQANLIPVILNGVFYATERKCLKFALSWSIRLLDTTGGCYEEDTLTQEIVIKYVGW